jgi:hypothetical protein
MVMAIQDITKPTNLKKAERDICLSSSGVRKEEKILRKFGNGIVLIFNFPKRKKGLNIF